MMHKVFITHAWRYHDAWNRIVAVLDNAIDFQWNNFSVPWYDPAFQPHDDDGYRRICDWLSSQIQPVDVILFLSDVYAVKSNQSWLALEMQYAAQYQIPIIQLGEGYTDSIPKDLRVVLNHTDTFNEGNVVEAIRAVCHEKALV